LTSRIVDVTKRCFTANRLEPIPLRLKALVCSLALVMFAESAAAQRPSLQVAQGSRVRVKTPNLVAPLIANFLEQRGDTLVFIEDGTGRGVWTFALSQIERLETTAGEGGRNQRYIARGALIGGGAGLVAGVVFASVAAPSDSTREYSHVLTGAVGAALGAGIGAIIGSRTKTERWVNVPLPRQLSLVPNGRGFSIAIAFR
jgi:hypothetical protein